MKAGQRGQVGRRMGPERVIDRRRELPRKYVSGCWPDAKEEFSRPFSVIGISTQMEFQFECEDVATH